jgi:hypothetical protein
MCAASNVALTGKDFSCVVIIEGFFVLDIFLSCPAVSRELKLKNTIVRFVKRKESACLWLCN